MSSILFSVRKETHSRCTKIAEKKCSALLYEHKMSLYLLDKEFIAGRSRFQESPLGSCSEIAFFQGLEN